MTNLYNITGSYLEVQEMLDNDVPAEAIRDTLQAIEGEFKEKAMSIVHVALNMDGDIEAIDKEIERLTERKRAMNKRKDTLKEYLRENMVNSGIKKITCDLFTITCAEGRQTAIIDDLDIIPDDYVDVKMEIKPRKNDISKALKEGVDIPGAHLERGKESIRIK